MFKTFLKIIPQLESSALNGLENALNSRFSRVAKRFASGLKNAILGGGIAALGLSVIDKLVNPLKQVNENINNIFQRAEDLTDQAQQFGTTTGTLLRLQTIGKSPGVSPEELSSLMVKFQGALVQARANPGEPSAVSQFTSNKDTADAFFRFLQGLKGASTLNRDLSMQEVFGERKVLGVSKFLSGDLDAKLAATSGINTGTASTRIENANRVGELDRTKQAVIDAVTFQKQSGMLTDDIATARAAAAQREANLQTRQLASFKSLENINAAADQVNVFLQQGLVLLADVIAKLGNLSTLVSNIAGGVTRFVKGIGKKFGFGG